MTISTTANSTTVSGNGTSTTFSFSFPADSTSDISVIYTNATGAQTTLAASAYTITLNNPATNQLWGYGGFVTYPLTGPPIAAGTTLTILRTLPLTQEITVRNQGNYAPQVTEQALDIGQMQTQQVAAIAQRSIQIPVVDTSGTNTILPAAINRANGFLSFDQYGNANISGNAPSIEAGLTATSTSSVTIATGAQTFTIQSGKFFFAGQYLIIANSANSAQFMHGSVTSYSGTTLVMNITDTGGSGTFASWNISISGTQGPQGAPGSGDVSSVAMTGDGVIYNSTVSGSPITSSGTLEPVLLTQTANKVLASPASGSAATPAFRSLVAADLPAATSSALGAVKPDNSTITISGGVISAALNLSGQAKAWGNVASGGTLNKGYNVASIIQTSTGVYQVHFTNPMSDTNYAPIVSFAQVNSNIYLVSVQNEDATYFQIAFQEQNSAAVSNNFSFVVYD